MQLSLSLSLYLSLSLSLSIYIYIYICANLEGPAYGLHFARSCDVPLRTLQPQKRQAFVEVAHLVPPDKANPATGRPLWPSAGCPAVSAGLLADRSAPARHLRALLYYIR